MKFISEMWAANPTLTFWVGAFIVATFVIALVTGFFRARRIQPGRFKWKTFRNEAIFAVINVVASGFLLGGLTWLTTRYGLAAKPSAEHVAWWVVVLEYAVYFFAFDTWFYWLHRWMHQPKVYPYIHKLHHFSTSPNLLTTLSVNPLESLVNGGFLPIFLALVPIHQQTMAFIGPTAILMGLYVHCGHEFLPRWWHKSWATKWFITTTFHDQHHKYFNYNFGGYTPIWDYICGTVRKKYEADFVAIKDRGRTAKIQPVPQDGPVAPAG